MRSIHLLGLGCLAYLLGASLSCATSASPSNLTASRSSESDSGSVNDGSGAEVQAAQDIMVIRREMLRLAAHVRMLDDELRNPKRKPDRPHVLAQLERLLPAERHDIPFGVVHMKRRADERDAHRPTKPR